MVPVTLVKQFEKVAPRLATVCAVGALAGLIGAAVITYRVSQALKSCELGLVKVPEDGKTTTYFGCK